jgi:hypothetical protein
MHGWSSKSCFNFAWSNRWTKAKISFRLCLILLDLRHRLRQKPHQDFAWLCVVFLDLRHRLRLKPCQDWAWLCLNFAVVLLLFCLILLDSMWKINLARLKATNSTYPYMQGKLSTKDLRSIASTLSSSRHPKDAIYRRSLVYPSIQRRIKQTATRLLGNRQEAHISTMPWNHHDDRCYVKHSNWCSWSSRKHTPSHTSPPELML